MNSPLKKIKDNFLQPSKAPSPIDSTVEGRPIASSAEQFENAPGEIHSTPSGIKTPRMEVQPEKAFLRMKRSALGRRIRDLDSFDSTCFRMCAYHFARFDYFEFPRVYESVTVEEIQSFLHTVAQPERCALSVIVPIGGN